MNPKEILLTYKNFAVLGVSQNKEKYGYKVYKRLKERNYTTYGISPIYKEVDGNKMYPDLSTIQKSIDVVVFVVNPKYATDYIKEMSQLHIKQAWMQPGTYNNETLELLKSNGIDYVLDCVLVQTDNL